MRSRFISLGHFFPQSVVDQIQMLKKRVLELDKMFGSKQEEYGNCLRTLTVTEKE